METLAPETITAGAIAIALIGALVSIVKIHDKRMQKMIADHQGEIKETRDQSATQTILVIDTLKATAVSNEKLSQSNQELSASHKQLAKSIDEMKDQNKVSADKLNETFYKVLMQGKNQ